jgi:hypothetical protein
MSALPPSGKREQLLQAARPGATLRYQEFKALLEAFGFRLSSMNRLHNIFVHPLIPDLINIQNIEGQIKPFQLRQALNLIYKYQLRAQDEDERPLPKPGEKTGLDA